MREVYRRAVSAGDRRRANPIAVVPAKAGTQCLIFGGFGSERPGCRSLECIERDGVDSVLEGGSDSGNAPIWDLIAVRPLRK